MEKKKYSFLGILFAILKTLGYLASWIIISTAVSYLVVGLLYIKYPASSFEALLNLSAEYTTQTLVIANFITVLIYAAFYKLKRSSIGEKCELNQKPFGVYTRAILIGVIGQFAIQYILAMLLAVIPESWLTALEQNNESLTSTSTAIDTIATILAAPILEEILCRGLVLGALKKAMPSWAAIGISALAFGLLHGNPIGIIYATLFGILLGFIVVKFKSVIPAILCHMAFNATSLYLTQNLGTLETILIYLSIPIMIVLIIKTAKYQEPHGPSEE